MKPYASYKPSGVPWLGEVPEHWAGKRLRDCVEGCSNGVWGDEPDGGEDDIPVIRVADFDRDRRQVVEYETLRKVESGQRGSRGLVPGDMLMEKSGGGEQQPVGMVVSYLGPEGAVCSNFVARMRSREGVVSRFMVYLHAYLYASRVTNISVKQTTGIQNLDSTAYLSAACFVPPPDEQQAIADYLDAETTRIDTLIHEKDELIGLLKEWRQSMIAEVVTKGLDKTVPMKPAGVPWLGDVPAHWKVKKLKHLVKALVGGATPTTSEPALWDDVNGTPWVAIGDMSNRYSVMATNRKVSSEGILEKRMQILRAGTVIYSMYASVGYASILGVDAVTNQAILGLITTDKLNNKFFMNYLNSIRESVLQEASSNTQDNINAEKVRRIPLLCPPLEEQQAIADYLDTETAKIDALIEHAKDDIVLLKELRSATIADAVLGRIDVRTH